MAEKLTLYGFDGSTYVRAVRMLLTQGCHQVLQFSITAWPWVMKQRTQRRRVGPSNKFRSEQLPEIPGCIRHTVAQRKQYRTIRTEQLLGMCRKAQLLQVKFAVGWQGIEQPCAFN